MRLVEAVAGKLGHQVKNILGLILRDIVLCSPGHEFFSFFFHDLGDLFTHGASQDIGITQGIVCQDIGNFHDLLLVDDDPVGLFKDRF